MPECNAGRGFMVFFPLLWGQAYQCRNRLSSAAGGMQCRIVLQAKVVAKPDELHLYVIPEPQLMRMRVEIGLGTNVVRAIAFDVVLEQGQWHDQMNMLLTVLIDGIQ